MPRRKPTAPVRLNEEEQQSSTWRMGEEDLSGQHQGEDQGVDAPAGHSEQTDREYTVTIDDNEEEEEGYEEPLYISSDDDDYAPPEEPKQRKRKPGPPRKKKDKVAEPVRQRDLELESLLETSHFYAEVRSQVLTAGEFQSSIDKMDILIDLDRYHQVKVELPEQNQFWVYVSDAPGRSFIYYEWFVQTEAESDKAFSKRRKSGKADNVKYFYIKDIAGRDRDIINAFSAKQRVIQLKFHRYYELAGRLEVKVCITDESLVNLSRPSEAAILFPSQLKLALRTCFNKVVYDYINVEQDLNHDIDQLYEVVKKHHRGELVDRRSRVQVDPQHRSLLPKLRQYQADAVRWMLEKENYQGNLDDDLIETKDDLHPLFEEVTVHDGSILYFNKYAGYLVRDKPLAKENPPGGILADEMGLGKTVEVLACMLNNPRREVARPDYLQPIRIQKKNKRSRRKRSPSPTEFVIREKEDDSGRINSDILKPTTEPVWTNEEGVDDPANEGPVPAVDAQPLDKGLDSSANRMGGNDSMDQSEDLISQVDGGDTDEESEEEVQDDENDEDFVPESQPARSTRPDKNDRQARKSLSRKYSSHRTVYYHEEFDDQSSDNEDVPIASRKKRSVSRKKTTNKEPPKKKAKTINTEKLAVDDDFPTYDPFKNGKVPEIRPKTSLHDLIVMTLADFREDPKNKDGVSTVKLKNQIKKRFDKDVGNPKLREKFSAAINAGVQTGQFIKTSPGSGATGSMALNPHFDPDDTRTPKALGEVGSSSRLDLLLDDVVTSHCYGGEARLPPHVPTRLQKVIKMKTKEREQEKDNKGELYSKLKHLYDRSLPMPLASYATDKSSKVWNSSYFSTKVDQRSFFECICGGTEETKGEVGYRVQCRDCGTEQHADCMKFNVEDPYRGEYVCPHCWVQTDKVPSGATLIVSPSAISFQWIEEIQKHVKHKDIKMFYYKGSKEMGYVQPRVLANYDIVITSYETLSVETNYVDLPHSNSSEGRRFRNPKRFMAMPSPITCIQWWRICLDEAQMIESTTTKTAEMALRLSAVNKWCVTGTPLGKSINDLQGLLLFLQIDPYHVEAWWRRCVYQPFCHGIQEPLEKLLCEILWRTCKKDVLDQIEIPGQSEETHWLQFSPVEEHFYRRQHIDITRDIMERLNRFDSHLKLSVLDRQNLSYILQPLLRLRQSCCHPQAVRGQFMNLQKTTMTMEQLLQQLIKKATNETEECHRQYVAALNGLAGIDIIQEKFEDAAENYREVLRSAAEHEGRIKTDTLQRLHTVHNLAELLEAGHTIPPTLRDSDLKPMLVQLKEKYMQRYLVGLTGARTAVEPVSVQVEEGYSAASVSSPWYQEVINWVFEFDQESSLMKLVHDELAQFFDIADEKEFREIQAKYPTSRIVMYKISEKLAEIDKWRTGMKQDIKELIDNNPETFLNKAVECHLRVSSLGKKKKQCRLCEVKDSIDLYENILFRFVKGEIKGGKGPNRASVTADERKQLEESGVILLDELRRGTWSDSEAERLCSAVHKFAKSKMHSFNSALMEDAANQMKLLDNLKKEFRLTRILLRQIFDQVAGVDELNMSTLRLRLRFEDEPYISENSLKKKKGEGQDLSTRVREKVETIYILERHELDQQRLKLVADKATSRNEMKKKLGQLLYLKNLQGSEYGKRGGHNPELCPICQKELGTQWAVLQCGHCYCVECIRLLLEQGNYGSKYSYGTKCAICRNVTGRAEISYVSTRAEEEQMDLEDVKGSHSTKVEAVVRAIIRIRSEDEDAKSLVFSTWPDVLDIIGEALDENDIPYASLHEASGNQSKFKRNIQKFKNREDVKVLLLPISRGANGLNLVEASHVLLVEPILNPAQELQAIGRIHRIGQKKATVVHRFLVRQTIEERIHQMLRNYHREHLDPEAGGHSTEENLLTIQDLRHLFNDEPGTDEEERGEPVAIEDEGVEPAPRDAESVRDDDNPQLAVDAVGNKAAVDKDQTANVASHASTSAASNTQPVSIKTAAGINEAATDELSAAADEQSTAAYELSASADEQSLTADEQYAAGDDQLAVADEQYAAADEQSAAADEQFSAADEFLPTAPELESDNDLSD